MSTVFSFICVILFCLTFPFVLTFLHEVAHALVILLYSGKIHEFRIFPNAFVSAADINFTAVGGILFHISGVLLPMIIGIIAILLYNPSVKFMGYHSCYAVGSILLALTATRWVAIPFISLLTAPPPNDDVTKFMKETGFPPLLISLSALIIIGSFLLLTCKKGIWMRTIENLNNLSGSQAVWLRIVSVFAVIVLVGAVSALDYRKYFNAVFNTSFTIENAIEAKNREIQFTLNETRTYTIEVNTQSQGFVTALLLINENGDVIEQNISEKFQFGWGRDLFKGDYTIKLIFLADNEEVEQFLNSTWQREISSDFRQFLEDVFIRSNDGDYSIKVSIQIR